MNRADGLAPQAALDSDCSLALPTPVYDWTAFDADIERRPSPPRPRRLGSARAGVMAGALLLGAQEALEPRRDRVPMEAPARRGGRPGRVRLLFDPVPRRTVAIVGVAVSPPS